jgi:hypothetical protein
MINNKEELLEFESPSPSPRAQVAREKLDLHGTRATVCENDGCNEERDVPRGRGWMKVCSYCVEHGAPNSRSVIRADSRAGSSKRKKQPTEKKRQWADTQDIMQGEKAVKEITKRRKVAAKDSALEMANQIKALAGIEGQAFSSQGGKPAGVKTGKSAKHKK